MFGYVIADREIMTEEQVGRYRAYYCGLCRALKRRHGAAARFTLNYDMTFLVLLLSSMCEPEEEESGCGRCAAHPLSEHPWICSAFTDYAADMNVALAYLNCLDDWRDERRLLSRAEAAALSGAYARVKADYPQRCGFIEERLAELADIESRGETDPDAGARCFGRLMGEVFDYGLDGTWSPRIRRFGEELGEFIYIMDAAVDLPEDAAHGRYNPLAGYAEGKSEVFDYGLDGTWSPRIRRFGEELGEFIYIMDAAVDLPEDAAHGRYNPLAGYAEGKSEEELHALLTVLIGEAAEQFERLPLLRDVDLMRNILYSGVWLRYNIEMEKRHRKEGGAAVES